MVHVPDCTMVNRPLGMSRKVWARLVNCRRKVKIGSEAVAVRKAEARGMQYYQCKACEFWHLARKYPKQ